MTLFLNLKGYAQKILRRGSLFYNILQELKNNEQLSYEQLINYQNQKLRLTVKKAYQTVPYYRQLFDELKLTPEAIKTIDDLQLLPIMSKSDIRGKEKQFVSNAVPWKYKTTTSGTTGTPVNLFRDYYNINFEHATFWRRRSWGKCSLDDPMVILKGDIIIPANATKPPFWKYVSSDNMLLMSSYHLSDRFIPYYLDKLRNFNSSIIEGFPSNIYRLARYMQLHQELPLNFKAVFTSSETLLPHQCQVIEEYLGQIFDYYGQSERVAHFSHCEHGNNHYVMDYSIVEFLPTKSSGLYKIVGTTLHNAAMPLIRYDTKDFVRISHRSCPCGRAFPVVDLIEGRQEDYIATPCGKFVGGIGIVFTNVPNLIEGQIIQEEIDSLRVLIVTTENFTDDDRNVLLKNIRERLGANMEIIIQKTAAIPRTKRGKFKLTLSKLNSKYGAQRELYSELSIQENNNHYGNSTAQFTGSR
ncbi:MAG: hypothetical protein QNJ55_09270 [Xenococcus sp. MO_188.B8]|nr:hypothetical protein [Xenococcus sp. MO_188.B8]